MTWTATITTQRQLTIPAILFHQKIFRPGEKVILRKTDDGLVMTSALELVNRLAGSVTLPKKYRGLSINALRDKAIRDHFRQEYKQK